MFQRKRTGFTLTEMMVVISIIAILAALVIPNVLRALSLSRFTKAKRFVKNIADASEIYQAVTGNFPTNITSLTSATPPFIMPEMADQYCNPDITLAKVVDGYGHVCMFNVTAGSDTFAYYVYADDPNGSGFYLIGLYDSGSNTGRYLNNETSP